MALSTSYFDWDSFRAAVGREFAGIRERKLWMFTRRQREEHCEVLVWRAWFYVDDHPHLFVGDRMTGPVSIWFQCYRKLLDLAELAAVNGLVLIFSVPPADLIPEIPPEEVRLG